MMPGTARQYLQMDAAVDARSDVWLAAEGAAKLLADNYQRVGSWPLALTGYNHGIFGIARAVRQVGSARLDTIIEHYQSRTFGFASRNFYAEFIAAATVFADRAELFPGIEPLPPMAFDAFTPGRFVSLLDLASLTGTDIDALVTLNPALHADVGRGTLLVPAQYPLRVPRGRLADFERAFARLPDARTRDRQITATYRVTRGRHPGRHRPPLRQLDRGAPAGQQSAARRPDLHQPSPGDPQRRRHLVAPGLGAGHASDRRVPGTRRPPRGHADTNRRAVWPVGPGPGRGQRAGLAGPSPGGRAAVDSRPGRRVEALLHAS